MKENDLHFYQFTGYALELLAKSKYHRQFMASRYFGVEIMPALYYQQARFYVAEKGIPFAMVTWAWLSKELETDMHKSGRALNFDEWNSGNRLFFNDFVAPYGHVREILRDLTTNVFPDHVATSIRRSKDKNMNKINRWTGVNYRKTESPEVIF